ncbi:helix-turn-helix domain-containing protein [Streptomyces sp. NPDC004393]|uniref:helix-turn-helix domain-containing protein n=1 Tax=Streptomyces sp. NPDC004533 TaxID=3154278 RepID=UPI0033BE172F
MSPNSSTPKTGQLSSTHCTTDSVPTDRRTAYWRETLSRTFGAVDIAVPDQVCSGAVRTSPLGRLRVATVESDPLRAWRTSRLIARGGDAPLVVKLLARGTARVEQDGRVAVLDGGEIVFCDMARPIRMEFPRPFETKSIVLPRRLLGLRDSDFQRITATPIHPDTTLGSLLSPFLTKVVDSAATYPPRTGEALAHNVVDFLTALAEEQLRQDTAESPSGTGMLVLRIQAFIDRHLAEPNLSPESIARAHQISVRYLHKLFQAEDTTVSRWIQRRRLQECRRELARRQAEGRTIAAVARRWGFTSAAHFSRAFRAVYGMSPTEWRNSAAAPGSPAQPLPKGAPAEPESGASHCGHAGLPGVRRRADLVGGAGETAGCCDETPGPHSLDRASSPAER